MPSKRKKDKKPKSYTDQLMENIRGVGGGAGRLGSPDRERKKKKKKKTKKKDK